MRDHEHALPMPVGKLARLSARKRRARAADDTAAKLPPRKGDGLVREHFAMPRDEAREAARAFLERWPKEAYWSRVEHWARLPDGRIEFTMARLPTAD